MDRPLLMAAVLAFLLLLLALMLLGWRRRQRSQSAIPRPHGVPDDAGEERLKVSGFYVATTVAGEPLNRIAVAGLGFRARATFTVTSGGLALTIPGQEAIFIPAGDIRSVEKATWTIDRAVEEGGLVLIRWALGTEGVGQVEVDSYLRLGDSSKFFDSVQQLHSTATQAGGRAK